MCEHKFTLPMQNMYHGNERAWLNPQFPDIFLVAMWTPEFTWVIVYAYEKVNTNVCTFILNLSKQAGNNACRGDLGRFPICNKIWNLSAKYWLRLEQGTDNVFLNNAFLCAKTENHKWVQQICSIMTRFGMGHIWPVWATYGPILHHIHQRMLAYTNACWHTPTRVGIHQRMLVRHWNMRNMRNQLGDVIFSGVVVKGIYGCKKLKYRILNPRSSIHLYIKTP